MIEYPKIQSIYKRDETTHKFIEGAYSLPEFEYLKDNSWYFTEKIDGTNIRAAWEDNGVSWHLKFGGRTANAQMPTFLFQKLCDIFEPFKEPFWEEQFPDGVTLFGEGYGAKIQKGGGMYIANGVDFILFDVLIGDWWLKREDVEEIAGTLDIKTVPLVGEGTLQDAVEFVKKDYSWSQVAESSYLMEGLVLRPKIELKSRNGHRIITKLKRKDF